MNKNIFSAVIILISTLLITALPTDAEAKIYEDTLRLHILANSDSETDQELKLKIRDKILSEYGSVLKCAKTKDEAVNISNHLISEIKESVNEWIIELGFDYQATVTLTDEWYDTREYEDFTLPNGYYKSLRIIIGDGDGKNWWCVMYPPLCMEIATEKMPSDDTIINYTKEELLLIKGGKYNVKFKILETLSWAFAKNG